MDPVEEFAALRDSLRWMKAREAELRDHFLLPGARLSSNRHIVSVRIQRSRRLIRDSLPTVILNDPRHWGETVTRVVTVRALGPPGTVARGLPIPGPEEDIMLIE